VPVGVFTLLIDNATCSKSESIYFYLGESFRCPNSQDWFGGEGSLELAGSLLLGRAPDKWNIFLGKIVERLANLEEVFNKASVKVGKANQALHFFKAFRDGPINNSFNFDQVNRDFAMTDNQAKIIYLGLFKLAFFRI
jgi:hypothetical protein